MEDTGAEIRDQSPRICKNQNQLNQKKRNQISCGHERRATTQTWTEHTDQKWRQTQIKASWDKEHKEQPGRRESILYECNRIITIWFAGDSCWIGDQNWAARSKGWFKTTKRVFLEEDKRKRRNLLEIIKLTLRSAFGPRIQMFGGQTHTNRGPTKPRMRIEFSNGLRMFFHVFCSRGLNQLQPKFSLEIDF